MKFRKKPVVIEAIQWTGDNVEEIGEFMTGVHWAMAGDRDPVIPTLEGDMKVSVNDWIIRGVKGEYYPCKPDIFEATYEPAMNEQSVKCPECGGTTDQDIIISTEVPQYRKTMQLRVCKRCGRDFVTELSTREF